MRANVMASVLALTLGVFGPAWADPPTLKIPATLEVPSGGWIVITAETDGKAVKWVPLDSGLNRFPPQLISDPKVFAATAPDAKYRVLAYTGNADGPSEPQVCVVTVGKPVPPGPGPTPTPTPGPAPIPADGLHVLVVYEKMDLSKYPAGQLAALYSQAARDYLNAKCAKGPDGTTAEWRVWDQNVPGLENESKLWQDAMKLPRQSLPWIIVSNPQMGGGYQGPLPATAADLMALLKKFGG